MEVLSLPSWTLSASLEQGVVAFTLGDGRRLAWRSHSPAECVDRAAQPVAAALLLGDELASRLAASEPRPLNVQYAAELDAIDWEALSLGAASLAERFALARQLLSDAEPTAVAEAPLTESLAVTLVHGAAMPSTTLPARLVDWRDLGLASAREAVTAAHVVIVEGVGLPEFLEAAPLPVGRRLLVLAWPESPAHIAAVLDAGATALCVGPSRDGFVESIEALARQLGDGASVGEAVRALRRRPPPGRLVARLYGDPTMRFVRLRAPTSRRQVTSLSFDLVGSTALLRRLGDEAYAEMLDSLHARCTEIVRRHGGQPDDPQGDDGVMCYFGHPHALEDAAVRAVEAGLKIVRTVSDLAVSVRVGIATGFVAVNAGQPVGLSIHLAAHLQKATAPGTVLASESTRSLVAHAFEFRRLRLRPTPKGMDEEQDAHLVIAPRGDDLTHRLDRVPLLTPFVGRRSELELLADCWRRACADERGLVVVRAEAGMGKSRVVREFRRELLQGGVKVLECRCRADASASPFLTLAEALRRWLDIDPHDSVDSAVRKLTEVLPEKARDGEPLALLTSLLGFAPQRRHPEPGNQRQRLLGLLVEWFSALAKDGPCCLIVEDWQWVDPSMRDFVQHLLDRPNEPRLLVVVTTRDTSSTSHVDAGAVGMPALVRKGACEIHLGGLPPAAARELVSVVCAGMPLPSGLVRLLASRGDGVPLFLEEAARLALELGANRPGADLDALQAVPASLQDLLMARLDGLGEAKRMAQVAAVLGREFSLPLLSALVDSSAASLDPGSRGERFAALVNSGLVRAQGGDLYAFKHALVRDAAYASLWSRDRIALHAQVVRLLQERWPEQAASRPELLAMHQTEAGLDRDALVQWELAARNAAARSAEIEAIYHVRRALAVLARIEPGAQRDRTALRLQLLLAARLIATEGYGAEAVLQAYREAEALCDRIGDDTARFKVEMGLEAYRFMRADFGMALEHGRRAAAIAVRSGDTKQRLHAQWGLACTLFHKGELRATMREMDVALGLYAPHMHRLFGIQDPGIMCMAYSSWALWELGRPDSALERIDNAVAIARQYEHKFSQAVALAYGVSIELLRGETEAALVRAETCIRVCEESGFPVWLAITRCMRGRLLCEQGRLDEGLAEMRAGHNMWLSTGAMVSQPLYLSLRAEGLLLASDLEGAAKCVDEGLDITERYGELQLQAELKRLRGEIALRRGENEAAESWLKRAYAQAMRQHRVGFALRSATTLARVWAERGEHERARRLLRPLTARWTEGRATRDVRAASALCDTLT